MDRNDALALTELKNHRGWKVFEAYLVQTYNASHDALVVAGGDDILRHQQRIEAIKEISSFFDRAECIEREARSERVNSLTGLATS